MSKLTDGLDLNDFGNTQKRGEKTLEAALVIGGKKTFLLMKSVLSLKRITTKRMVSLNQPVKLFSRVLMRFFL